MKLQHAMTWKSAGMMACGAVAAALFVACGQDAAAGTDETASSDTASAYAALSASVQGCADKKEECVTAAAGDAAKLAACDAAAESCMQKTQSAQSDAKRRLRDDAEGCMRRHGCRGDDDAGVDERTRPDMHDCVGRSAPVASSECRKDLFDCLDKTGLKQSTAQTDLDQATKDAIVACVQTAHTCFVSDMGRGRGPGGKGGPGDRGDDRGDRGDRGAAGSAPRSDAGRDARPGFPGAEAGRESHHAAGGPSIGDGGRPGGRGQRDAAGAAAPGGRGRRDGAGGAGGN